MDEITTISLVALESYRIVWYKAIYDKTYDGSYCSDFNTALAKHVPKIKQTEGIQKAKVDFISLEAELKKLSKCPKDLKPLYNATVKYYTLLSEMYGNVESPDGSLQSFTDRMRTLSQQIESKSKEIKLKHLNDL